MKTNNKIKNACLILLSVTFWIAVWHLAAKKVDMALVLPTPAETFNTLISLMREPGFIYVCAGSVLRIFLGALIGVVLGSAIAVSAYVFPPVKYLISPIMSVIKSTPVASFIVLLLVLIGKESIPSITAALISIPILFANIFGALESMDKSLSEVCRVYSLSFAKRWRALWYPSLKPRFISGMKSCIGLSWKAGIAAEVLCTPPESIGIKIHESRIYLETPSLFAWTAVVIILSLIFEKATLCVLAERRKNEY